MSANFRWKGTSPQVPNQWLVSENRTVFLLFHSGDHVILSSFVLIGYQYVTGTDRQTDGQTDGIAVCPWLIQCSPLQAMWPHCKIELSQGSC